MRVCCPAAVGGRTRYHHINNNNIILFGLDFRGRVVDGRRRRRRRGQNACNKTFDLARAG